MHKLRLLGCALLLGTAACSPLYVVQAGIEEARILSRRRPIERVIRDEATDSTTRRKLALVLQARDYAGRVMGLDAGDSYTTYSYVDSDTLLMVVSGARKDRFEPHTWWFPIVGRVPYKGFFDFDDAYAEAARLERAGFDAYVRPSGAFSTLGWFNDPLLNTLLRYDDVGLAGTVIHEILHNTVYLPSQAAFNESFANFVGERGAIAFFCDRDGPASASCRLAQDSWHDNLLFGEFLSALVERLEAIYGDSTLAVPAKLARREAVFADARERFTRELEPRLRTAGFRGFTRRPLNNATLIGTRLYYERLPLFEQVFQHYGGDVVSATRAIIGATRAGGDPYAATEALLSEPPRLVRGSARD